MRMHGIVPNGALHCIALHCISTLCSDIGYEYVFRLWYLTCTPLYFYFIIYMHICCTTSLAAKVPLIEAGTTGYLGQVTVIDKPSGVECYECQTKPTQKVYPICTIRSTPSMPVHCIVWAKELYKLLFGDKVEDSMLFEDEEVGKEKDGSGEENGEKKKEDGERVGSRK